MLFAGVLELDFAGEIVFASWKDWADTDRCMFTTLYNCLCLRRQQNQISAAISTRPVIPPTIPPMRTPLLEDSAPALIGVVAAVPVGEAARVPVAPSEDVSPVAVAVENVVGDTSELVGDVVVPVLSLGILDMAAEVVVDSSSGQIPVVQGSLEQHP